MMTKNVYNLLRILLKQKSKSHVKRQKSKLLIYDIYLKKYVSADELLTPSPAKDRIESIDSWKKSKDFMLFDLLLKKFINPKLDLLSPPGANIKSKIWHLNSVQGCRYASTLKDFWERGSGKNSGHVPALPSTSKAGDVVGWAGQVIKKPESNPRPEQSTTSLTIGQGDDLEKNSKKTQKGRSYTEKEKSKKYDKNSARNGALLYEGKSEKKKKSTLAKSFKTQKDVKLQNKSKNKLWAKKSNVKYGIFTKSINALKKAVPENSINTYNNKELITVKPPKREKGTLFKKICSQMFSFRKSEGTDGEENLNKGNNLQKKDVMSKDGKTPFQTNNSQNEKSVVEHNTSDLKLVKNIKELQKVPQNIKSPKSERSVVENNTSENKFAKHIEEHHNVIQSLNSSQNEKPSVKNKTSENNLSKNVKEHQKVSHNLSSSKSVTFVVENNTSENKLANSVKEHHKFTQSLTSSQNEKPYVKNKIPESKLTKHVKEHQKVTLNLSSSKNEIFVDKNNNSEGKLEKSVKEQKIIKNSKSEKIDSISKGKLEKSVKDDHKVAKDLSSSKSVISHVKTSEITLAKSNKEHYKATQYLSSSENEKTDARNNTSENKLANCVKESDKVTQNFTSSKNTEIANETANKTNINSNHIETKISEIIQDTVLNLKSESSPQKLRKENPSVFDTTKNDLGQNSPNLMNVTNKTDVGIKNDKVESEKTGIRIFSNNENNPTSNGKVNILAKNTSQSNNNSGGKYLANQNAKLSEEKFEPDKIKSLEHITFNFMYPPSKFKYKTTVYSTANNINPGEKYEKYTLDKTRNQALAKTTESKQAKKGSSVPNLHTGNKINSLIKSTEATKRGNLPSVNIFENVNPSANPPKQLENLSAASSLGTFNKPISYNSNSSKVQKKTQNTTLQTLQKGNISNKVISGFEKPAEDTKATANPTKHLVNQSASSNLGTFNKLVSSNSNTSKVQKKTQNVTLQTLQKGNTGNKVISGFEKLAEDTKASSACQKKVFTKVEIDKNEVSTKKNHNIEAKSTEKLHAISAQGKFLEDIALDGELNQYNIANYKGFKILNSNSDTQVTKKNLAEKSTLKEGLESSSSQSKSTEKTLGKSTALQKSTELKNSALFESKKQVTKKNLPEKSTLKEALENSRSQSKCIDKTLGKPAVLPKNTELKNSALHESKKQVTMKNLPEKSTLKEGLESSRSQSKCTDKPLGKPTVLPKSTELKNSDLLESKKQVTKENLPEQSTLKDGLGRSSSQSKYTDRTLGESTALQKTTELKSIVLYESKKKVTEKNLPEQSTLEESLEGSSGQSKCTDKTLGESTALQKFNELKDNALHDSRKQITKKILPEQSTLKEGLGRSRSQSECIDKILRESTALQKATELKSIVLYESKKKVTEKNLPEQSTLEESLEGSNSQSKCTEKTLEESTALQKSNELKDNALHDSQKQITKKILPEQSTLKEGLGRSSSQSKYTDKTLEKPTALRKSTELKNSPLHKSKKQVTNNKVILKNKITIDEKNKDVNNTNIKVEARRVKDQETTENDIPSNKTIVVESTKEVNKHQQPNKNAMVESMFKSKKNVEQYKSQISTSERNEGDKNNEESPTLLPSGNMKRNNYIKGNKLDHRIMYRHNRRKLMKPVMFKYSMKKSRKFKNPKKQEETKHIDHRNKKESIGLKEQSEQLKIQAKSDNKNRDLSKIPKLVSKTQLNKQQRSKSVPVFPKKKTVSIRKQENEKQIIKSKSVENLLFSKKDNSEKQTKSLRKFTQVQSSKIKKPLSEVKYSLKQKSKFSNKPLNSRSKKSIFQSLERINVKAQDDVRKGKITTKMSLPTVNPSNLNKTPKTSTSQKGLDSLKNKKKSTIYSQVTPLSKRTVAPKVPKKVVGTISSPELSNQIEDNQNRRGKQFDVKSAKKLRISKPNRGSKTKINLEQQNNRDQGISGREPKASRSKSESESIISPDALKHSDEASGRNHSKKQNISLDSEIKLDDKRTKDILKPKNQTSDMENDSLKNMVNSVNVSERELITSKNYREDISTKNSPRSLKLVKSKQTLNSTENHTNENELREDGKTIQKPKIIKKQTIINTIQKNINYNKKSETKKMVSLSKVASNKIKDMAVKKDKRVSNYSKEADKQEIKTERSKTVVSTIQSAPKPPHSSSGTRYQDRSNLNNVIAKENKNKSPIKDKNVKVNLNSKDSLSDSSFILPNIKNDVAKKSLSFEKYLKKHVKSQVTNTKTENRAQEDYNIESVSCSQSDRAAFKSENLSGKLEDEKVVPNSKSSKNKKIDKSRQMTVKTKESGLFKKNTHYILQQEIKDPDNKTKGPGKELEIAVFHTSKVSDNEEQLSKDGNKTTMAFTTKQTVNNSKAANKEQINNRNPKNVINNRNQSVNSLKTNNNDQNQKGKVQELLNRTEHTRNTTKDSKKESSSGRNTPKVLKNKTLILNTPKTDTKNPNDANDPISSKTLHYQKFNNDTVNNLTNTNSGLCSSGFNSSGTKELSVKMENYNQCGNKDKNKNFLIKCDSNMMGNKIKREKSYQLKNEKSPVATSESKVVKPFKTTERNNKDKDVTTAQQKLRMENSELKNNFITRNIIHLRENNKFITKIQPLKKLSSKKSPNANNETNSSSGITSKFRGLSKTDSDDNKTSSNLKEEQNKKKEMVNKERNPLSSLHDEIKHNVRISTPNKNIIKTESKGTNTAISKKEGENININKSSLIKDKAYDVSPDMSRKLSSLSKSVLSAKLSIKETNLSSPKSDHTLERRKSPPHEEKIEGNSSKEPFKVKQQGIKDNKDQFLKHLVQVAGIKNNTTRDGIAKDNTTNIVKIEEPHQNISLETKKTASEMKEDLSEIGKSQFKTQDHTSEKLRLMLENIKSGSNKKCINNKEPSKQFSEIEKEENKITILHKVQDGNKNLDKCPKPKTLNLKDKRMHSDAQLIRAQKSEEDSRLIQLSKNFFSLKTKELNDNDIKLDENFHNGRTGQITIEKEVLKNESFVQLIKNIEDSMKSNTKMNSSTTNDLPNLMDEKTIKSIFKNEKAEIKSTKCDSLHLKCNQSPKAPFIEDAEKNSIRPKKKERKSLESFKNHKTSQ